MAAPCVTPWILKPPGEQSAGAKLRLFCVPPLATGAYVYHDWSKLLPAQVELMPIELPGRNSRMVEPGVKSMSELANQVCLWVFLETFTWGPFGSAVFCTVAWVLSTWPHFASSLRSQTQLCTEVFCAPAYCPPPPILCLEGIAVMPSAVRLWMHCCRCSKTCPSRCSATASGHGCASRWHANCAGADAACL